MIWRRLLAMLASVKRQRREGSDDVPDHVLESAIQTQLRKRVRHPQSVEVTVRQGLVTMGGPILLDEMDEIGNCLSQLRGVRGIESRWEICEADGASPEGFRRVRLPQQRGG